MPDEQDRPDQPREPTPPAADPAAPDNKSPAKKAAKAAKAAKKVPAKKAPAKKAPAKAVKKAAAKKAPPKIVPQPPEPGEPVAPNLADTNGEARRAAANEAAAQAKRSVQSAPDSLTGPAPLPTGIAAARLPAAVAFVIALLAILMIRRLRASDD